MDLIRELRLPGASLSFIDGYTAQQPADVAADPIAWAGRMRRALDDRELAAADVFLIPDRTLVGKAVNHPDASERAAGDDLYAEFLTFATSVGSAGITILPGMVFDGERFRDALARAADRLRHRLESARTHGLELSVEPHIVSTHPYAGSLIDTPEKVAALLDAVPGLKLTLDYGHFNVQGIPDREVEPLLEHARHFHMRGGAPGLVQTTFEKNTIDFARVLDVMERIGYDGWVELEYVHDSRPGCSSCDNIQEVRKFRDFIRSRLSARKEAGNQQASGSATKAEST